MTIVRTVLGDVHPGELGPTYAHEHVVIAGGRPVELFPDFRLDDADLAVAELAPARELGLRTVVDAMPADAGRDPLLLAEISRRAEIHVVAATGVHHERYYDDRHWSRRASAEEIADLFVADVEVGIDAFDYGGPIVRRTPHRAGVIKVAGSERGPSKRDTRIFEAAALAHARTGVPILTHCEHGTGAIAQLDLLTGLGVPARHVILSHVDRLVDKALQREVHSAGAFLEYDQGFRWGDAENGTLRLLEWAAEDAILSGIVLGMDAARRGYWSVYGGSPGWTFLLGQFSVSMRERGLGDSALNALFVANPARAYAFAERVS